MQKKEFLNSIPRGFFSRQTNMKVQRNYPDLRGLGIVKACLHESVFSHKELTGLVVRARP